MQRMVQPGGIGHASTSDTIKAKSKRPCLVVRPAVSLLLAATVTPDLYHTSLECQQMMPTRACDTNREGRQCHCDSGIISCGCLMCLECDRGGLEACEAP